MQNKELPAARVDGTPPRLEKRWDIGAISAVLDQTPDVATDIAYGPGVRYGLADGAVTVELFPPHRERDTGIVRLCTADSRQEFFRQTAPTIREDGLIFQSGEQLLTITPVGQLTHRHTPARRHQSPADASNVAGGLMPPVAAVEGSSGDAVTPQTVTQDTDATPETQLRVHYAGRLGTEPRTKQTPKGRFVMEFPVAVAIDGQEKPEWRQTVVFDAKARTLDGVLHKGTAVEVVAYEHHKTKTDPATGRRRDVREYYATAVTPKLRNKPADAGATGNDQERPAAHAVSDESEGLAH